MFSFTGKFDICMNFIQGLMKVMVLSTCLFQVFINLSSSGMSVLSKCTIKNPVNTGPHVIKIIEIIVNINSL